MKKFVITALIAILAAGTGMAQHPQQRPEQLNSRHQDEPSQQMHRHDAHHHGRHHGQHPQQAIAAPLVNADGIDMAIVKAFPTVKKVTKTEKWTEVYDDKGVLLGYAVYSKPASDGIKGYNGETPVLIALNAKKKITGVYLLSNNETPRFAQRVQESGFYDNWNGLSIKKARKKKVDTVSGATYTSRAIAQSVQAALERL